MPKFYAAAARDGAMMLKEIEADTWEEAWLTGLKEAAEYHNVEEGLDEPIDNLADIEMYLDGFAIDQVEE